MQNEIVSNVTEVATVEVSKNQIFADFLKGKTAEELLTIISLAAAEAKKAVKAIAKAPKEKTVKKGSMPTGVVPIQLHKPRAWVDFIMAHANTNGWPAFSAKEKDTIKEIPASVTKDGKHVFEDGDKPLNNKQAMSLSKMYWSPKEKAGTREDLYQAFEAQYVPPQPADLVTEPKEPKAPKEKKEAKPKKTEEEKEADKRNKAAAKKAENAKKKADEAAKKAEEAKQAADAAKESPKAAEAAPAPTEEKPKPKAVAAKKKTVVKADKDNFSCEDDDLVHDWEWKGKSYLRNFSNQVWERTDEGEAGTWCGVFDPATLKFDASAEEPVFDDEE
jgi:hypothetical protein